MFKTIITISLLGALFFGLPFLLLYIVDFISDLFKKRERKNVQIERIKNRKRYSLDPLLLGLFFLGLYIITYDFEFGKGSGIHSAEKVLLGLVIMWSLLFFGIYKIVVSNDKTITTFRLLRKQSILIAEITSIQQTLGYYKVSHKAGVFRFTDLLTGSTGLVNSLVAINPEINYQKFELKDLYKNPMGSGFLLGFIETAIIIGIIIWIIVRFYINS